MRSGQCDALRRSLGKRQNKHQGYDGVLGIPIGSIGNKVLKGPYKALKGTYKALKGPYKALKGPYKALGLSEAF